MEKTDQAVLRKMLENSFNKSEIRTLCFDLRVDYENVKGDTKEENTGELISYFQRRGRLHELIATCHEHRPNLSWPGWTPKKAIILDLIGHPYEIHCIFQHEIHIGRSSECDIYLRQAPSTVSNWHTRISYLSESNIYSIRDLDSTNGTIINNSKIQQIVPLTHGSHIGLGKSLSFEFEYYEDDPLAIGSLIYRTNRSGKELSRYIIVPKEKAFIGNLPYSAIRLPYLNPGESLGHITRTSGKFYYVAKDERQNQLGLQLHNNIELTLASFRIRITIL